MIKVCTVVMAAILVSGCAGLEITPISKQTADSHASSGSGYVIYEPLVVYPVNAKKVDSQCEISVGQRQLIQNRNKPYKVRSKVGLGQADVSVTLTDGWILGNFTDKSNNNNILQLIATATGIATAGMQAADAEEQPCEDKSGLYTIDSVDNNLVLKKIQLNI